MPPLETRDRDPYWAVRMTTPALDLQDMRDDARREGSGQAGIDRRIMRSGQTATGFGINAFTQLGKFSGADLRALGSLGAAAHYRAFGQGSETPRSNNGVARWAEGRVGRPGYGRFDKAPDARGAMLGRTEGRGGPKCNQFVWDALRAGGAPAGRLPDGRIPLAGEWGDPATKIPGYSPVTGRPEPGDVVSDGDHVGIYAPLADGRPGTVSAAGLNTDDGGILGGVVHNDWGFRKDSHPITVWRSAK